MATFREKLLQQFSGDSIEHTLIELDNISADGFNYETDTVTLLEMLAKHGGEMEDLHNEDGNPLTVAVNAVVRFVEGVAYWLASDTREAIESLTPKGKFYALQMPFGKLQTALPQLQTIEDPWLEVQLVGCYGLKPYEYEAQDENEGDAP